MTLKTSLVQHIQDAFRLTDRGVIGIVDEVLALGRDHRLQLVWQSGRCRVQPLDGNGQDTIEVPLPKSVFRAILARLAAMCNERSPNAVSPYGGQGEIVIGGDPQAVVQVTFTNTGDEQRVVMGQV
ncbi:MAG: hypothetical protein U0736_16140, partial [Gemmataceae bacterium]